MSACNPLDIVTEIILESLCTADISSFTRHRHIAPQQNITTVGDERLSWPALGVSGEVVSEEPGTESHLGVFHQRGVQDKGPAVFSWQ